MAKKYVYLFSEGNATMRELLGGKGANLADLRRDAKMTLVSATSIVEGGYHDVTLKTAQQPNR